MYGRRVVLLGCRYCRIVYTPDTVTVVPQRWGFTQYDHVFRVDGQWPLHLRRAIRQRYWRRPRGRIFQLDDMRPVEIIPRSGRWPRRRPAALRFTSASRPAWTITVPITEHLLIENPGVIHLINDHISGGEPDVPWRRRP